MKYLLTVIITAAVVGFGVVAYFKGWLPYVSFQKPQAASVQNIEVSNERAELIIPDASPSATPSVGSSQAILDEVKAALIAKHGSDFASLTYSLGKVEGNYASGSVGGTGGGGMWYAANVNGKWVIVWDGNGTIMCSDLSAYPDLPTDMISECLDASGSIVKR